MGFDDLFKKAADMFSHAKEVVSEKAEELKEAAEAKAGDLHLGDLKDSVVDKLSHAKDAVMDAAQHPDQLIQKAKDAAHNVSEAVSHKIHDLTDGGEPK
jgi:vacuolar-type H+-ATPase subunit H